VLLDLISALDAGATDTRTGGTEPGPGGDDADRAIPVASQGEFADARAVLGASIRDESGVTLVDRNADGFWEERVTVADGLVRRWETDRNQDGVTEVDLRIAGGEPASVTLLQSPEAITVRYGTYPFAASVSLPSTDGSVRYRVRPFTLTVSVLQTLPVGGPRIDSVLELSTDLGSVDLSGVARASVERELLDRAGNVVEVHGLVDGAVVTARRDTNADGRMDHLVVYKNGKPVNALRDIDGDGYFEVAESYVNGEISMVSVDEDDNGTPDVTEYAHNSGERTWDLNQDGVVDVREFGIWSRSVTVEFPFLENRQ